jgi:dTDP-glucose 4,6-dehydratase
MRIFNTYGPRMRADDGRLIPALVTQALSGKPLTLAGDGAQTRSLCYVDDLIGGIICLHDSGYPGPVNLGNPCELSVREIADHILRLTGTSSPITYVERPEDDPNRRCPDISIARQVLGWKPSTDLTTGLRRTIDWFRQTYHRPES